MILESVEAEIQLPPAEFLRMRSEAGRTARDINETALFFAQHIWDNVPEEAKTAGGRDYSKAVASIAEQGWMKLGRVPGVPKAAMADVMIMRQGIADAALRLVQQEVATGTPAPLTRNDVGSPDEETSEHRFGDCTLVFNSDAYSVEWELPERDQSIQRERKHPIFTQMIASLDEVRWTLDTGGLVETDLEFMDDEDEPMRGNRDVAYGPLGAVMKPRACKPFTLANGAVISRNDFVQLERLPAEERLGLLRSQVQPTAKPEARFKLGEQPRGHVDKDGKLNGGQFTFKASSPASVNL